VELATVLTSFLEEKQVEYLVRLCDLVDAFNLGPASFLALTGYALSCCKEEKGLGGGHALRPEGVFGASGSPLKACQKKNVGGLVSAVLCQPDFSSAFAVL
jgi:hypothetical protein